MNEGINFSRAISFRESVERMGNASQTSQPQKVSAEESRGETVFQKLFAQAVSSGNNKNTSLTQTKNVSGEEEPASKVDSEQSDQQLQMDPVIAQSIALMQNPVAAPELGAVIPDGIMQELQGEGIPANVTSSSETLESGTILSAISGSVPEVATPIKSETTSVDSSLLTQQQGSGIESDSTFEQSLKTQITEEPLQTNAKEGSIVKDNVVIPEQQSTAGQPESPPVKILAANENSSGDDTVSSQPIKKKTDLAPMQETAAASSEKTAGQPVDKSIGQIPKIVEQMPEKNEQDLKLMDQPREVAAKGSDVGESSVSAAMQKEFEQKGSEGKREQAGSSNEEETLLSKTENDLTDQIHVEKAEKEEVTKTSLNGSEYKPAAEDDFVEDKGRISKSGEGIQATTNSQEVSGLETKLKEEPLPAYSQISKEILNRLEQKGPTQFQMTLEPADLGQIEIKMQFANNKLVIDIAAANSKTQALLSNQVDNLVMSMGLQNVKVEVIQSGNNSMTAHETLENQTQAYTAGNNTNFSQNSQGGFLQKGNTGNLNRWVANAILSSESKTDDLGLSAISLAQRAGVGRMDYTI